MNNKQILGLHVVYLLLVISLIYMICINHTENYDHKIKDFYNNINRTFIVPHNLVYNYQLNKFHLNSFELLKDIHFNDIYLNYEGNFIYENNQFYIDGTGKIKNYNNILDIITYKNELISYNQNYINSVNILSFSITILLLYLPNTIMYYHSDDSRALLYIGYFMIIYSFINIIFSIREMITYKFI